MSLLSRFHEFEYSLVWEFKLLWELGEIHDFKVLQSLLRDWLQISRGVVRKIIFHMICFAY